MVGVVGYLLKTLNGEKTNLIDYLLNECAHSYTENETIKVAFAYNKVIGIVVPKGKALYDYAYDIEESRGVIIYGYVIIEGRRLSAKEVIIMKENEVYEMLPLFRISSNGDLSLKLVLQLFKDQLYEVGFREFCFIVGRGKEVLAIELKEFYRKVEPLIITWRINQLKPKSFSDAAKSQASVGNELFLIAK